MWVDLSAHCARLLVLSCVVLCKTPSPDELCRTSALLLLFSISPINQSPRRTRFSPAPSSWKAPRGQATIATLPCTLFRLFLFFFFFCSVSFVLVGDPPLSNIAPPFTGPALHAYMYMLVGHCLLSRKESSGLSVMGASASEPKKKRPSSNSLRGEQARHSPFSARAAQMSRRRTRKLDRCRVPDGMAYKAAYLDSRAGGAADITTS